MKNRTHRIENLLGRLALVLIMLIAWSVERRERRAVLGRTVAQLVIAGATMTGWIIDCAPWRPPAAVGRSSVSYTN
jgi:hypothetical protein